nr:unnamed protein product [Callosobruchus chinensis]
MKEISAATRKKIKPKVTELIFNDDFIDDVQKHLEIQDPICNLVNICQSADTSLADAVNMWLKLEVPEVFADKFNSRQEMALNVYALTAYFLHPTYDNSKLKSAHNAKINAFLFRQLDNQGIEEWDKFNTRTGNEYLLLSLTKSLAILNQFNLVISGNTAPGSDTELELNNDTSVESEPEDELEEIGAGILNMTASLKFATLCETPNHDPGYCVEIKSCSRLLNQLSNSHARDFLRDSMCGPENEDLSNPKVCCGRHSNYRNKLTLKSRVVGGKEAELGEFPWMARILHKNRYNYKSFGCSGFLIHSKYVMTAAHCVHDKFLEVRGKVYAVHLGEHNIETEVDCMHGICADPPQVSRVAKVIIHPDYNPTEKSQYNDIAILFHSSHLPSGRSISKTSQVYCKRLGKNRDREG